VIKLLSFSNDLEWDDLKLFEREAETLKSLSHPAIPRYLDYFEVNSPQLKGFALVQTYIPAKTLEEYIKAGRTFTKTELKYIAKSLLEILVYLHNQNPSVIHREFFENIYPTSWFSSFIWDGKSVCDRLELIYSFVDCWRHADTFPWQHTLSLNFSSLLGC